MSLNQFKKEESLKGKLNSSTFPFIFNEGLEKIKIRAQSIIDANKFNPHKDGGDRLRELGRNEEAVSYYEKAIKLNPNDFRSYNNIGLSLEKLGKMDDAEDMYRKSLELASFNLKSYNNLIRVLLKQGKEEEVEILRKRMITKLNPNDIRVCGYLIELGEYEEAKRLLKNSIRLNPNDIRVCGYLIKLGEYEEAERLLKNAIKLNPDRFKKHNSILIHFGDGGLEEELESDVIESYSDADLYFILGNLFYKIGIEQGFGLKNKESFYEKLTSFFNEAIKLNPRDARFYNNLGLVIYKASGFGSNTNNQTEEMYKKAIELDPSNFILYCNLGELLVELGRLDEAEESYRKAIELKPNKFNSYYMLGLILPLQKAKEVYEDALKIAGGVILNKILRAICYRLVEICEELGDKDNAKKYLDLLNY